MKKGKLLSLALSLLLLIGLCPTTAFAAEAGEKLWVNGVDVITAPDNTVLCGVGTASYNAETQTLLLDNATIDTSHNGNGIAAGEYFNDKELTIELNGTNVIAPAAGQGIHMGIYIFGKLKILGAGSMEITTGPSGITEYTNGIYAFSGCTISGVGISLTDTSEPATGKGNFGIDVNSVGSSFMCNGASINISGYEVGINEPTGHVNIINSNISITNANRGINGGVDIDDFKIQNSTVDCTTSGDNGVSVANGRDILIDNSRLTLTSGSANAIYSAASLKIENGSEINATGGWTALYGETSVSISNSIVDAVSTNDIGIFSRNSIQLTGGQIHAKGGTGFAAIAARVVKGADETAESKIVLTSLFEKDGGKSVFSDWFAHSSGQTRSWTSFVAKDTAAIEVNTNGGLANALNEVWLAEDPCFFGHDYSTEFTIDTQPACTTDGSKSMHCLRCGDKTDITVIPAAGHTESDWIIDKQATFTEEGARHTECTVCKAILKTEAIAKFPSQKTFVHTDTGISMEYEDGSVFDAQAELVVTPQSKDEMSKLNGTIDKAAKGLTLAGLYDIQLLKNGVAIQPDGKVRISIPLTDAMKAMTDLKVVYINDDGNVTIIPSQIVDGKIIFTTDHFSYYGIIGKAAATPEPKPEPKPEPEKKTPTKTTDGKTKASAVKSKTPPTGDALRVLPLVILIFASSIIILKKRKLISK